MTIQLSREEARQFLVRYHFTQTNLSGVFTRLGTIQYDPLNPVGRNPDLVLQARVPGYQIDDWQKAAYQDRLIYDAWDKQACLVPVGDWPLRAQVRTHFRPYHDREILQAEVGAAEAIFAKLDQHGPLSSLEFEQRQRVKDNNPHSWSGTTVAKRLLRAMWACGLLVTHHRQSGRHYYDRPERVIPAEHYQTPALSDEAYYRWIILRRYQATGLLRPNAEACIWSACGDGTVRKKALAQLIESGDLTGVKIGDQKWSYYMPSSAIKLLDVPPIPPPSPRMIFLGPLDNLLWDRKGVQQIFDFDYIWEVYKPAAQRRWGYYVLPVFYGNRFVARLDSYMSKHTWNISKWWWEPDVLITTEIVTALQHAVRTFLVYLGANDLQVSEDVETNTRDILLGTVRGHFQTQPSEEAPFKVLIHEQQNAEQI
jgi:uncharacterized protein